ncbi:MAG: response regulator transcription factor [Rhizonema sp. NSF051]|nr:response regulator transcription factor [Rhizonema sp. NSF051]
MSQIKVIVIDDHELTRFGIVSALSANKSIQVCGEAENGLSGLSLIKKYSPDLALVDINLPDINGAELCQKIKSDFPATKVLILTADPQQDTVTKAFKNGADSYCIKNLPMRKLVEAVCATCRGESWIDSTIGKILVRSVSSQQNSPDAKSAGESTLSGELCGRFRPADFARSSPDESEPHGVSPRQTFGVLHPADFAAKYARRVQIQETQLIVETNILSRREIDVLRLMTQGMSNKKIAAHLYISAGTVRSHVHQVLQKLSCSSRAQAAVKAIAEGLVEIPKWGDDNDSDSDRKPQNHLLNCF